MKKNYIYIVFLMITNIISAQVGIGTPNPDAALHVLGNATSANTAGTVDLINENFEGYIITGQTHSGDPDCPTSGWVNANSTTKGYECTPCSGSYLFIDTNESRCYQDATVSISFTPTQSSVNISFDYGFREDSEGDDFFRVYIHDGASQVGSDLLYLDSSDSIFTDASYTGSVSLTPGVTYTLRFQYYMESYAYGATVDNVIVQELTGVSDATFAFRLEDGQHQEGYVLTSDANGYATWKSPSTASGARSMTQNNNTDNVNFGNENSRKQLDDVFVGDFITTTNIHSRTTSESAETRDLNKGLQEILSLNPISYKDEMKLTGKTILPENLKEPKLGFYVDELLEVIPEAVKIANSVNRDKISFDYNQTTGIKFTQLIPVIVNAVKEQDKKIERQNEEIPRLKNAVVELKKQNELLRQLIKEKN